MASPEESGATTFAVSCMLQFQTNILNDAFLIDFAEQYRTPPRPNLPPQLRRRLRRQLMVWLCSRCSFWVSFRVTDFRYTVLDLPQIASRPSYDELIQALAKLKVKPASWGSRIANQPQSERERKACARYLTNIISSNLTWLPSDAEREKLWEEGSKCLAERCGRTGRMTIFLHFTFRIASFSDD